MTKTLVRAENQFTRDKFRETRLLQVCSRTSTMELKTGPCPGVGVAVGDSRPM